MNFRYVILGILLAVFVKCGQVENSKIDSLGISGDLIIFHAGSMSVPLRELAYEFEIINSNVDVKLEAAGSVACVRKITDLDRECDIFVSADYKIIDELLIPDFTKWNIQFSLNEIVLIYNKNSKYFKSIDAHNWYNILMRDDVYYGRSDPNSDPCGYRTVLCTKLAEKYYKFPELSNKLLSKDREFIRPKASDLLALLEINAVDYIFEYKSVAEQHKLPYLIFSDSINLKSLDLAELYYTESVDIAGKKPGEYLNLPGEPIVYGLTILSASKNPSAAESFVRFMLTDERGQRILEGNSQPVINPVICNQSDNLPLSLSDIMQ